MFSSTMNIRQMLGNFQVEDTMMRYSIFVPRLYNLCKSLGFTPGKIIPSRAFCSDESQGFPIILLTKHFGTFPFNHGRVGSIVDTDRHGPHAEHGKDVLLLQASHVGYDPETKEFGHYRRLQTESNEHSANCGKIDHVLSWYLKEYHYACENIYLSIMDGIPTLVIDNQLLSKRRDEGLFLDLDKMVVPAENGVYVPHTSLSTAKCYAANPTFSALIKKYKLKEAERMAIGEHLDAEMFRFKRNISEDQQGYDQLEHNLLEPMSWIVTSSQPLLTAAQVVTQVEFDRTYRTIIRAECYKNKRLMFIAGLNIDISPQPGQLFPLTKFVPWAAYIQDGEGNQSMLEQKELYAQLMQQSTDNAEQIDLESAITQMQDAQEIKINLEKAQ